ncbi:type 4a pilus biogenesis protein PilO [bacterium]|nr:type 4a pilus biogenesis protein PilO [bacterium]MCI0616009.1 type 4a pilus biogenesis protein PilO [bacterium]
MAIGDTVKSWPWYGQVALFLTIGGGLFYFGQRMLINPINEEMTRLSIEKEELIAEINKGETLKARFIEFEAELKRLETQLESLKKILPSTEEIADLYSRIQQEGTELGLAIAYFKPGNHVPKEFYDEWPISMTLNGNYHILAKFFERIGKLYRIINVNDFSVKNLPSSRSTSSSNTISATCIATTFIYKEGEPPKPTKKKGAKTP